MDGTIYLSNRLFSFTKPFLKKLEETEHQQDYLDKLSGMGIPVTESQVFLSTQVILEEMQNLHREDSFFIVGTPNLVEAFRRAGLRIFDPELEGPGSMPDVVILGFDTTLTYERISLACKYLRHGSAYYGVNMDYNCPVDDNGVLDYIPDCGSIAKLVERSTGRFPDFYGKPSRHALESPTAPKLFLSWSSPARHSWRIWNNTIFVPTSSSPLLLRSLSCCKQHCKKTPFSGLSFNPENGVFFRLLGNTQLFPQKQYKSFNPLRLPSVSGESCFRASRSFSVCVREA